MKKILIPALMLAIGFMSCKKDIEPSEPEREIYTLSFKTSDAADVEMYTVVASLNGTTQEIAVAFPNPSNTYSVDLDLTGYKGMQLHIEAHKKGGEIDYSPIVTR
jgi:hypothetical protein